MSGRDRIRAAATGAALAALVAGCATPQAAAPPAVRAVPPPLSPAPPAPPPAPPDWRDVPLTPGEWSYSPDPMGSQATFGPGGAPVFVLRCDRPRREIRLSRSGAPAGPTLRVRTSYGVRTVPGGSLTDLSASAGAGVPASDSLLDEIAFSRGRFTVETDGAPTLVIPAWAEPARVIEDCRD
jgi:hypothetical protein